ncbi:Predicted gene 11100 [Apodemus speciosus]|uniref:Predicted gene 11100 n=1 Tax=Apodemus speciosus TaxID=105296 RepID=A0ABQ0FH66_APOSI
MERPQFCRPELPKLAYGKIGQYQRIQQPGRKNGWFKGKGIERWHRAASTNSAKQNVLVPKEESLDESNLGFHESQSSPKRNLVKKMKSAVRKMLSCKCGSQSANAGRESFVERKEAASSNAQGLLPRLVKELPSSRLFTKPRMRKLSQNATIQLDVVEAETEEVAEGNRLLRAKRTTKRLSVTSLPSGLQKVQYSSKKRPHFPARKKQQRSMEAVLRKSELTVGKLQMQVDDLIETVTDKSMKLLEQRHAELKQCEFLGAEILQSSKQFQRLSKRTTRKYRLRRSCFPCSCCCCC